MAELRDNYLKSDVKLSLINELRTRPMTRKDIQNFFIIKTAFCFYSIINNRC